MGSPEARAETARQLREEVRQVLAETGLFALLTDRFGEPTVTGSAGYDLMVWRDIDIHLPLEAERWSEWMAFGQDLAAQLHSVGLALHKATFVNDWVDPHPLGAGLYWGIEFKDFAGNPWKLDLWGWDPFDFAVRQARDFSLRTDLAACDRDLILRLKTEARERDDYYGVKVSSWDIYQFAIAKAGDSLSALELWKARQ
ncbi:MULTISPECIES: hypothetical protein [unclassified Devosia]|uniref:hypothetical protein n=1 Tax=unclassified Devosia TaxID=196773 RepID=UPI001AD189D9|nr:MULTISPECIES: hypothetical protein [unclassified Devosia]MBN9305258.1 hypothetical protein [Devosia sp.]